MHSFVSGPLAQFAAFKFTAGIQNYPGPSPPRRCRRRPRPRPGMQRARPLRRRRQRPASGWPWRRRHRRDRPSPRRLGRPGGSAPDLAAGAGSGRLQVGSGGSGGSGGGGRSRPSPPEAPAVAMSRALAGATVVDVFFAAAVPAGGARRSHVPCACGLRRCGRLLRRGRPCRRRPQRLRLRWHCRLSKFYSGETAESIPNNSKCCDMENKLVPLQRNANRWDSLDPILMQINFAR